MARKQGKRSSRGRDSTGPRTVVREDAVPTRRLASESEGPTLAEVLVSFQKSLALAMADADRVARANPEIAQGQRPLYTVDGLDVKLNVGVRSAFVEEDGHRVPDRVLVDFDAPAELRSELTFHVDAKPLEQSAGPTLILADATPAGGPQRQATLRAVLTDGLGDPMGGELLTWHCTADGASGELATKTNEVGRVELIIDVNANKVTANGGRKQPPLDLAKAREFFVWVHCEGQGVRSTILHFVSQTAT